MKCLKCNQEVSENQTVCPNCNTPLNIIPATPNEPALPQDQGYVAQDVEVLEMPEVSTAIPEVNNNFVATSVENHIPTAEEQIMENGKLGTYEQAPVIDKQKQKAKIKIVLAIVILFIVMLGLVGFGYYYEFQTSTKRIQPVVDKLLSKVTRITNDEIEFGSGSYTIDASLDFNNASYKTNITGKYGYDLENKIIDVTSNLNSLKLSEELISTPLSTEIYLYDNVVYLLFQNFLNEYIYSDVTELPLLYKELTSNLLKDDQINNITYINSFDYQDLKNKFNNISQNDINYQKMIASIKNAFKKSLNKLIVSQTIAKNDLANNKGYVNIVTISFNERKNAIFMKTFLSNLTSNKEFITELSKLTGLSEEKCISKLTYNDDMNNNVDFKVDIYTALFKNEFIGLKIKKDKSIITVIPSSNGYKIKYKENGTEIVNLDYTSTLDVTSTTKEVVDNMDLTYYYEKVAYKFNFKLDRVKDINPKVEKVNVKNSVRYNNLSVNNYLALEKIKDFGKLGLLLKDKVDYDETANYCKTAINCKDNLDGTKTCNYCILVNGAADCTQTITCK